MTLVIFIATRESEKKQMLKLCPFLQTRVSRQERIINPESLVVLRLLLGSNSGPGRGAAQTGLTAKRPVSIWTPAFLESQSTSFPEELGQQLLV